MLLRNPSEFFFYKELSLCSPLLSYKVISPPSAQNICKTEFFFKNATCSFFLVVVVGDCHQILHQ